MLTFPIREAIAGHAARAHHQARSQGQSFPYLAGQAAYLQPQGRREAAAVLDRIGTRRNRAARLIEFLVQTGRDGVVGPDAGADSTGHAGRRWKGRSDRSPSPHTRASAGSSSSPAAPASLRCGRCSGTRCSPSATARSALIYSVRSPEEFAYMQEFQRLEDEGRIDFRHTVTRAATGGWTGRQGRIDVELSGRTDRSRARRSAFVCGPPALVGEIPPAAEAAGRQGRSDTHRKLGGNQIGRLERLADLRSRIRSQSTNLPIYQCVITKSPSR